MGDCGDGGIPVLLETVSVESESENREDQTEEHWEKSEFRLVNTFISGCAEFDDGIGNGGHENGGKDTTDCGTNAEITDVGCGIKVWWRREPLCHDEGYTNVPCDN